MKPFAKKDEVVLACVDPAAEARMKQEVEEKVEATEGVYVSE